jgi:hypothetical protein
VTPTLPAITLQAYTLSAYPYLSDLLARHAGDIADLLPRTATAALERLQATAADPSTAQEDLGAAGGSTTDGPSHVTDRCRRTVRTSSERTVTGAC